MKRFRDVKSRHIRQNLSEGERAETKKCQYCSEEILADAKKCRFCGEYLDDSLKKNTTPPKTTVVAKEGCFLQTLNAGCILTVVIIGLIILAFLISRIPSN